MFFLDFLLKLNVVDYDCCLSTINWLTILSQFAFHLLDGSLYFFKKGIIFFSWTIKHDSELHIIFGKRLRYHDIFVIFVSLFQFGYFLHVFHSLHQSHNNEWVFTYVGKLFQKLLNSTHNLGYIFSGWDKSKLFIFMPYNQNISLFQFNQKLFINHKINANFLL